MSGVFLIVLAILLLCGYVGWKKGIIKIVLSILTMVITILFTVFLAPIIANAIKENTTLYDQLYTAVSRAVSSSTMFDEAVEESIEDYNEVINEEISDTELKTYAGLVGKKMKLPDSITEQIESLVDSENLKQLQSQAGATVKNAVAEIIAERMTQIIFQTIIHLILFVVLFAVLRCIVTLTGIITMLPVIHQANKTLGLVAGIIEGLLFVWVLFAVITAFGSTQWASSALSDIGANPFLSFIYDNNLILKSVFKSI
jgi:uncharacterized membrane protein required for colicin V production